VHDRNVFLYLMMLAKPLPTIYVMAALTVLQEGSSSESKLHDEASLPLPLSTILSGEL
jgi:hypothetical protein